ncbi:LysR substrate-binding domain-containing protein [Enterococcus sp. DIV1420a]|uniref:LysR substrate-binding domain-containing protein n=1 Tax=Enterococcus sp. DIV1420a TaxID=2774672 RepID=UPI003F252D16
MNLMIDYRYRTFLDLVETKNYTRTAENLNFSQPAITKHIQYIESILNIKLFTYEGRQLNPTFKGNLLYEKLKILVSESEEIISKLQDNSNLRIGVSKTIGEYFIINKIKKFNETFPHSEIFLMVDNTVNLLDLLRKRKIDLALISGPVPFNAYQVFPFIEDEIILVCSSNHPLANKRVSTSDVLSNILFVREKGSGILKSVENSLKRLNIVLSNFEQVKTFGSISLIKSLVCQNEGISFMYGMSVADELKNKKLSKIQLNNLSIKQSFYAVKNQNDELNDTIDFFSA